MFPYRHIFELSTFKYGCLMELNIKERTRQKARGTDEQPLSDMSSLIRCGKITEPGSSNLKAQHKVLC